FRGGGWCFFDNICVWNVKVFPPIIKKDNFFIIKKIHPPAPPRHNVNPCMPNDHRYQAIVQDSNTAENCPEYQSSQNAATPLIRMRQPEENGRRSQNHPNGKMSLAKGCENKSPVQKFFADSCSDGQNAK